METKQEKKLWDKYGHDIAIVFLRRRKRHKIKQKTRL